MVNLLFAAIGIGGIVIAALLLMYARKRINQANQFLSESRVKWKDVKRDIENEKREAFLKIKDDTYKKRQEFEIEMKRERMELDRLQSKLNLKYERKRRKS